MFARVLRSRMKIDKMDDAARTFEEDVIPLCRKQRGFEGGYFMGDPKTGESITITFWESREAMIATEQSRFFQEQVAKFIPFYTKPPVREIYDVILKEESGPLKD
ncbi:MAG: antibiotic biosynthesis monooxygenase [Candidatus Aminicenantales bacterium]